MKKRKRGRPKNSIGRKKRFNAKLKGKDILSLKCKKCKRVYEITVNKIELYTEEIKNNWVCILCKNK